MSLGCSFPLLLFDRASKHVPIIDHIRVTHALRWRWRCMSFRMCWRPLCWTSPLLLYHVQEAPSCIFSFRAMDLLKPSASASNMPMQKMATSPPFPVLSLPQELQDRIFEFNLTIRDKVTPILIPSSYIPFYKALFPLVGRYEEDYQDRRLLDVPHLLTPGWQSFWCVESYFETVNTSSTGRTTSASRNPRCWHPYLLIFGAQRRRYIGSVELKY